MAEATYTGLPLPIEIEIWGASWWGDLGELASLVAEYPDRHRWDTVGCMDCEYWRDGEMQETPLFWSLPWVVDWHLDREMADARG